MMHTSSSAVSVVLAVAPHTVQLAHAEIDTLGPRDVRIATDLTSISTGTERQMLAGSIAVPGGALFPYIPGYEATGHIVEAGDQVPAEMVGSSVFVGGSTRFRGVRAFFGAQSEQIVTPVDRVVSLEGLDVRTGLLIGLTATALHGLHRAGSIAGASVLICGQGAVGRLTAIAARHQGAAWIAVADIDERRLAAAAADEALLVSPDGGITAPSRTFDLIIEASGSAGAFLPFLKSLRRAGTIVLLGFYESLGMPYVPLFFAEPTLVVSREWGPEDPAAARTLLEATREEAAALLTHDFSLADVSTAFHTALHDPACQKAVLHWT